ncbi:MAG: DegT/DnrJ/EryC1/StrS family aminotransferase [Acidobacteriia bacterium]|nr:DegT/DnrJ/EryC1/StrS family aminotransferase [Terriglobia bacterium]
MSAPDLDESDVKAVLEVLPTGRLSIGPKIEEFERAVAEYAGVPHAVAVSSGTAALHLAVKGLGIGPGDEVLVPSFTFAASVNAILYERGTPVFVDVEPDTYNLDPADLERKVTPRTRAIMAVDVFGHPVEWDAVLAVARRHALAVVDDSCEALGAEYRGTRLGRFGDAAAFAFYPNKQITTGEGGILVTADERIARLARSLRNQGRSEMGAWLEHERLGFNYRMDEMSAALGVSQLRRLESHVAKRARVARMYGERLAGLDWVRPPIVRPHVRMSWFVYVVTLEEGLDRGPVMAAVEARGVPVRAYFSPIHLQPYILGEVGLESADLPVTEAVARRTIALPFHNNLTEGEVERVVEAVEEAVTEVHGSR